MLLRPDGTRAESSQKEKNQMFTINHKTLAVELGLLQSVAEKKTTIPILECALLDFDGKVLTITATDLDVTLTAQVQADGEAWAGCVPLRQLASLSRLFDDDIQFTPKPKEKIEIRSGASRHLLPSPPKDSFPPLYVPLNGVTANLAGEALREGLTRVLPSVTDEESRWNLAGVQFETKDGKLYLAATNGHRLGVASLPCKAELKVLIPRAGLTPLIRLESEVVEMQVDNDKAQFKCEHRTLTVRLLVGTFPQWEMLMPKAVPNRIQVDSQALISAIKRVRLTSGETFKNGMGRMRDAISLTFSADSIVVESRENDRGKSVETVNVTSNLNGKDYPTGFNADYLLDFLNQIDGVVIWEMKDENAQHLLTVEGVDFRYVVMPTRL